MPHFFRRMALPLLSAAATIALSAQSAGTITPETTGPATPTPVTAPVAGAIDGQAGTALPQAAVAPVTTNAISEHMRKEARRSYEHGSTALREGRYDDAARDFAVAVRDDPSRPEYYQGLVLARESHVSKLLHSAAEERASHPLAADRLLAEARGVDPSNPLITQRDAALPHAPFPGTSALDALHFVPAGAIEALPNHALHSFHERTDTRAFALELGRAYGLQVAFDTDLQSRPFRVDLDDADYTTAIGIFNALAGSFVTPLDEHTLFVAADTSANRKRLEHLLQETVPLPGYSTEQINEIGAMLRTVFNLQDQRSVQFSPLLNSLVLRAPEDTLHAMDTIIADLVDSGSEVTVDVKLYSVDTSKARNLGVVLPTSFTLFSARSEIQNVLNTNSALIQQLIANGILPATATPAEIAAYLIFIGGLGSSTGSFLQNTFFLFGGGLSSLGSSNASYGVTPVGLATASFPSVNFALQKSEASTLDDLQLRVGDRQTTIFKAGSRYPIQTSITSGLASSTTSNPLSALLSQYLGSSANSLNSSASIPQFQYEDIGLTVNATPRVMSENQIALKLEIKVSALAGTALNGIPVLANREFASSLQLQDGQTVMMSSHVQDNEAAAVSGIPGLNSIPGLSNLTNRQTNTAHTSLVLLITPHIVRHSHGVAKGPYVPLQLRRDDD